MSSRLMPPKPGRDRDHRPDDLVGIGGREADRPGVDAGELLEEDRLALHHRQRGLRADVAEPEHGGAVGDDRDRVALARERPDLVRVVGDRAAGARDAGRVRHREVVGRLERDLGRDLELAAAVEQQRPVGDLLDFDAVLRAHRLRDAGDVLLVDREDRHVADLLAVLEPDEVDRVEEPARLADRAGHPRERARAVVEMHAEGGAERRRGVRDGAHRPSVRRGMGAASARLPERSAEKPQAKSGSTGTEIGDAAPYLAGSARQRRPR